MAINELTYYLEFNQQQIATDKQGYLLDHQLWQKELAVLIAEKENLALTECR